MTRDYRLVLRKDYEPIEGWQLVSTPGASLDPDYGGGAQNYGWQDIVPDPARPSDFYAFLCYQGCWKSTDYGLTFNKVSTGTLSAQLAGGRPWAAAVDPDPQRDPNTPPALWTMSGYNPTGAPAWGIYKSTDGGVNWTHFAVGGPSEDTYSIDVNPYDKNHLLITMHDVEGVMQSFDGGGTWAYCATSPGTEHSRYVFFVDTGNPVTTALTWFTVPQSGEGAVARRTDDGGVTWTTPTSTATIEHGHGCYQIVTRANTIYAPTTAGIFYSADGGATFTSVDSAASENGIVSTSTRMLATYGWAYQGTQDPHARDFEAGVWDAMTAPPVDMTMGAKRGASTYHAGKEVAVLCCFLAGIWRYVYPS